MFTACIFIMMLFVAYRMPGQVFEFVQPSLSGIDFRNDIRETDTVNILVDFYMFNGGGVAVGDLDNDGLQDIVFTSTQQGIRYYKNLGGLRFRDETIKANLLISDSLQNTGVLIADLNGDGLLDVYISRRYSKNRVFINRGQARFEDVTETSPLGVRTFTTQASQLDYDRDGDLDLLLVNSGEPRRKGYINPGTSDILFRNDSAGSYTNVSSQSSIADKGYGLSAGIGDIDDDGWPDIYIANDFEERDKVWLNKRDGTFEEVASARLPNMSWASMGSDVADINSDGMMDVVTVDMLPRDNYRRQTQLGGMSIYGPFFDSLQRVSNTFQLNRGGGQFVNIGHLSGMSATDWSWTILAQDFDLDADVDLFVSNGTKRDLGDQDFTYNFLSAPSAYRADSYRSMPSTRLSNFLFMNRGNNAEHLRFDERGKDLGLPETIISNGAAYADLDNDGDMDLVVNNTDTVAFVYRNTTVESIHPIWCGIVLRGDTRNIQGIGARVTWSVSSGTKSRRVVQECYAVRGFQSTSDARLVVALHTGERIDSVVVDWSNGTRTVGNNLALMRYNTLTMSTDGLQHHVLATGAKPPLKTLFARLPDSLLPFRHRENSYDDFKRERLVPYRFSKDGPAMAVGDVNGDKLADVITAGAKYQPTQCFMQRPDGSFEPADCGLDDAVEAEDIDVALVDVDGDKDLDLIVVTGGSEFETDDVELNDRLYLNDGKGNFVRKPEELATAVAGSCVVASDYDSDGDVDLFVGGRVVPGRFPELAPSVLYANVKGHFVDVTDSIAPGLRFAGMTTSAQWVDIDNDNDQDLVVVGEWMTPRVWRNVKGRFTEVTSSLGLDSLQGWWCVVRAADVDGDGDQDLVLGNNGVNCLYRPTPSWPIECFAADFDDNGSIDPLIFYYVDGKLVPTRGRTTLIGHMPTMTRSFTTFSAYASASIDKFLTPAQRNSAVHLVTRTFESGILRNTPQGFVFEAFPNIAQVAPIKDMLLIDVDNDNDLDILAVGNSKTADGDNIGYDAGMGLVMRNDGSGRYAPLLATESGVVIRRECRRIVRIPRLGKPSLIGVTTNSSSPILFTDPSR
ncbi:MAG: hypothetical protein FJ211_02605 [Ignavibacteria bacterium]|nr:hypothetical protein [Ignavibacteria bacterium]